MNSTPSSTSAPPTNVSTSGPSTAKITPAIDEPIPSTASRTLSLTASSLPLSSSDRGTDCTATADCSTRTLRLRATAASRDPPREPVLCRTTRTPGRERAFALEVPSTEQSRTPRSRRTGSGAPSSDLESPAPSTRAGRRASLKPARKSPGQLQFRSNVSAVRAPSAAIEQVDVQPVPHGRLMPPARSSRRGVRRRCRSSIRIGAAPGAAASEVATRFGKPSWAVESRRRSARAVPRTSRPLRARSPRRNSLRRGVPATHADDHGSRTPRRPLELADPGARRRAIPVGRQAIALERSSAGGAVRHVPHQAFASRKASVSVRHSGTLHSLTPCSSPEYSRLVNCPSAAPASRMAAS